MSDIGHLKGFYGLLKKPKSKVEEQRIAEIHERERRERKEKLYSYPSSVKSRNTLP